MTHLKSYLFILIDHCFSSQLRPPYPPGDWPVTHDGLKFVSETKEYQEDVDSLLNLIDNHCSCDFRLSSGERIEGHLWIDLLISILCDSLPKKLIYQVGQSPQINLLNVLASRVDDNQDLLIDPETGQVSTTSSRQLLEEFKKQVEHDMYELQARIESSIVLSMEIIESSIRTIFDRCIALIVERTEHLLWENTSSRRDEIISSTHATAIDFFTACSYNLKKSIQLREEQRAEIFLIDHWIIMVRFITIYYVRLKH